MPEQSKKFEMELTEDEFAELEKEAKIRHITMKEVIFEEIRKGRIADVSKININHKHEYPFFHEFGNPKEASVDDITPDVKLAIDSAGSWVGWDFEKAALRIKLLHEWGGLNQSDFAYFFGILKDRNDRLDSSELAEQLKTIADIFKVDVKEVEKHYNMIRVVHRKIWTISEKNGKP
ncbi:MAG TPA: hypothetical protein VLU95_03760 [Candidatus Acidoferrum sp.]|nr:hypothetical protein [Candidatus Acidoferrum sp.]